MIVEPDRLSDLVRELTVPVDEQVVLLNRGCVDPSSRPVTTVWTSADARTALLEATVELPEDREQAALLFVEPLETAGLVEVNQ